MERNFFKNKYAIIIMVILIGLVIFMGLTSQERDEITVIENWIGNIYAPVQRVVTYPIHLAQDRIYDLANFARLNQENQELVARITELERQLIDAELSNRELDELRGLREGLNQVPARELEEIVTARIISKTHVEWFNTFTIDAGTIHNVEIGSLVISERGLVGRVIDVGDYWSRVMSIVDTNSSVSFKVLSDNSIQGIASGGLDEFLEGYLLDTRDEVELGDQIVTSGQGLFPSGILIGEVAEITSSSGQLLDRIKIEPAVDFRRINRVTVINF